MLAIADNLVDIRERISAACDRANRDVSLVELVAVSKTFPVESVIEAYKAGQVCFGESRLQEAEPKIDLLPGSLRWHFIGGVQRNKVRRILQHFEVIHAVDTLRLASYVNEVAKEVGLFPKVFLQVNIGREEKKGGFLPKGLEAEMEGLLSLDRIEILGLMCIPPVAATAEAARPWFSSLREMRDKIEHEFECVLPSLSMGMSGDFEVAIEEGSTHVRVGSSIFGKRAYRVDGELG